MKKETATLPKCDKCRKRTASLYHIRGVEYAGKYCPSCYHEVVNSRVQRP